MKDEEIISLAREALDEAAEHLPWRVTHRLATAREAALAQAAARLAPATARAPDRPLVLASPQTAALGSGRGRSPEREDAPSLAARIAAVLVPILIVLAGLFGIAEWDSLHRAGDLADIDEAVLTDEVPISAYADRGFGVFLRNAGIGQGEPQ